MKKLFVAQIWLAGSLWLLCGVGAQAETLHVKDLDVNEVRVFGSVEVEISQGDERELFVRGPQKALEKEPFYVRGNTLFLGDSAN